MNAIIPIPPTAVSIRDAVSGDVPFIDTLQKLHSKQVGFMRTTWIEAKIAKGEVIVAVDPAGTPLGYCMGVDRYFKRDDVGIIHQMNVVPGRQRSFIGATLLKAMFERSAYGCRLFCCWCAQDLAANRFWESMGFVPLAFRAGSEKKSRVHIFWQKRIRAGDVQTPWWFPAKTDGGVMRADRIVLPIPPGLHWSDEMPVMLPQESVVSGQLSVAKDKGQRTRNNGRVPLDPPTKQGPRQYGSPPAVRPVAQLVPDKPKPQKKPKAKADPKLIAAARELRDRWLERVNDDPNALRAMGKYDVSRLIEGTHPAGRTMLQPQATHPTAQALSSPVQRELRPMIDHFFRHSLLYIPPVALVHSPGLHDWNRERGKQGHEHIRRSSQAQRASLSRSHHVLQGADRA